MNQNLIIIGILLWVMPWKGYALWKAAKNNQRNWFIILLVINTLAILEIVYLKFFQKKRNNKRSSAPKDGVFSEGE